MTSPNTSYNPFLIQTEVFPDDPKEFIVRMSQIYQDISLKTNLREISEYSFNEIPNGQQMPGVNPQNPRNGFRKVIDLSALALGANNVAHGIVYPTPNTIRFTEIRGIIENLATMSYQPIPNDDIHLEVIGANIIVTIPAAYVGFTGRVFLDYTKTN